MTLDMVRQAGERRRTRAGVLVAYGVITMLGAGFFAVSFEYEFVKGDGLVGPGFLPRIVGALLVVLGALLVLQEVRVGSNLVGDSGTVEQKSTLGRATVVKLASVFGIMTVALLLVPFLGLLVPLAALVLVVTVFVERMPLVPSILVTVGAGAAAYVLFVMILQFPVPMGLFEGAGR
jgi:hypothetical protein